jgi:hypothetical protein
MRMLPRKLQRLLLTAAFSGHGEGVILAQIELRVVTVAQPLGCGHDLVQHQLQPLATRQRPQQATHRLPFRQQSPHLFRRPDRVALVHEPTLRMEARC